MSIPTDRTYLETHEWHKVEGDTLVIGISQPAVDALTDITYVSLPKVGTKLSAGARFGEIESVKATSDLYSGVDGEVTAVNETLNTDPAAINRDPYKEGWMIKVKANAEQAGKLLSPSDYEAKAGH